MGAAVTLSQILASDEITSKFGILSQAARMVALPSSGTWVLWEEALSDEVLLQTCPLRLLQEGWRQVLRSSGEHRFYHSILKNGKCVMAHPSDMAPALVALKAGAVMPTHDIEAKRVPPLAGFFSRTG